MGTSSAPSGAGNTSLPTAVPSAADEGIGSSTIAVFILIPIIIAIGAMAYFTRCSPSGLKAMFELRSIRMTDHRPDIRQNLLNEEGEAAFRHSDKSAEAAPEVETSQK